MPILLQVAVVVALAALVGLLWRTRRTEDTSLGPVLVDLMALLRDAADTVAGDPPAGEVSILAMVTMLRDASERSASAARLLAINVEASRAMAERAKEQLSLLVQLSVSLGTKADEGAVTLADIQTAASGVADDLAASHLRADAVIGSAGAAADAASQSPTEEPCTSV